MPRSIRAPWRATTLAMAMLAAPGVLVVGNHRLASAQACDTACPVRLRDGRGCCPGSAAPPRPPPAPAPPAAPEKPAGPPCPAGQERSGDTQGRCCWPGQAWAGSRCVGTPSSCPDGYDADAPAQACTLRACPRGKERTTDGAHCCFPGQAWAASQSKCIGRPTCPGGFEPQGDDCFSNDRDGDGRPNATDRCPDEAEDDDGFEDDDGCVDRDDDKDGIADGNDKCPREAEDKNQFQDADGCPDERARATAAAALSKEEAAAAAAKQAAAARAEAERRADAAHAAEEQRRSALAAESDAAEGRRRLGFVLTGVGVGAAAGMTACLVLGGAQNDALREGGYATAADIDSAVSEGQALNIGAVAFGIVGAALVGVGVPLILLNGEPEPPVAVTTGPARADLGTGVKVSF